jgi:pimeloyl-ACP methyl ester carboxylesterase
VVTVDVKLADGRVLRAYDAGPADGLAVVWHDGTPNLGAPPAPPLPAAVRLGVRFVTYDRPGYGGSTRRPGRDIGSAATDATAVADALGVDRFAAAGGREAKKRYEASGAEYDHEFTDADHAALSGAWSWLDTVAGPAMANGPGGLVDDDLAYVRPWGCDPASITAPIVLLHGDRDGIIPSSHGEWLARHCPSARLRRCPGDGDVSVLAAGEAALEWLPERVDAA